jgi:hypothetical protein
VLACWPALQRTIPALRAVDIATTDIPILKECREAYEALREERLRVEGEYQALAANVYHTLRGGKIPGFLPKALPKTEAMPPTDELYTNRTTENKPRQPPSQKAFSLVVHGAVWLTLTADLDTFDRTGPLPHSTSTTTPPTPFPHRELARFISTSQPCSGAWGEAKMNDAWHQQKSHSGDHLVAEQRRLGLHLSVAVRAGLSDPQGHTFANGREHT